MADLKCPYCGAKNLNIVDGRFTCISCGMSDTERYANRWWDSEDCCEYEKRIFHPDLYELTPEMVTCLIKENDVTPEDAMQSVARNEILNRRARDWWNHRVMEHPMENGRLLEWMNRD